MWIYLALIYILAISGIIIYDSIKYNKDKTIPSIMTGYLSDLILFAFAYAYWFGSFNTIFDQFAILFCVLIISIELFSHIETAKISLKEDTESTFKKEFTYSIIGTTLFYLPLYIWMLVYTIHLY